MTTLGMILPCITKSSLSKTKRNGMRNVVILYRDGLVTSKTSGNQIGNGNKHAEASVAITGIKMQYNETEIIYDLLQDLKQLHGYMTTRRTVRMWYFVDPKRDGYVSDYPQLPTEMAGYQGKFLALLPLGPYDAPYILVYTGKVPPQELCRYLGWSSQEVIYTEEAVS